MFEDIGLLGVITYSNSTFQVYYCFQYHRWLQIVGRSSIVSFPSAKLTKEC